MPDILGNPIAASTSTPWDSEPSALVDGFTKLFREYFTHAKEMAGKHPGWSYKSATEGAVFTVQHIYMDMKDMAVSALASAAGSVGGDETNIRVAVFNQSRNSVDITLYVRRGTDLADESNDLEVGTVRMSYSGEATVENGVFASCSLSLTPAGSQVLWQQGGVINVESN